MIKAIVFDLDGMVYITDELFSSRFSKEFDVPLDDVLEFFKNDFSACQRGELDMKKALKKYLPKWGWTKGVDELLRYWYEDGALNKEMADMIKKLRERGIACILLTNNEKYRIEYLKEKLRIHELFDHMLVSFELGVSKPDERMADKILEVTGLQPNQILLCDDKQEFLDAFKKQGFVTLLYRGVDDFKEKLAEMGVQA